MRKSSNDDYEEIIYYEDDEKKATEEFNKSMELWEQSQIKRNKEKAREKLEEMAQNKIISKLIEQNIEMKLKLNKEMPDTNLYNYMKELYIENKGLRDELFKNEDAKNPIHYFLTMRPHPLITYEEFIRVVKDIFKKKWLKDYVYVIEQSGINEDECGNGFHLHAIIKRHDKRPSEFIREIKSTVSKLGDVDKGLLDIEGIYNNENGLRNRMNYILGSKKSNEVNNKELKQNMDIIFRQKKELKDYYFFGEFFSPYITEVLDAR